MTIVVDKVLEDQLAQGVNALVQTVAYNVKLVRGIDSEIKDLTSDIQTFSARLIEASKNSWANDHHVLRVVVKKFGTVVNEAQDTIADYLALKGKHVDNVFSKSLDKIPFCGKIKDFASEIQSIRAKLAMIRQDHGKELLHLMTYKINEQNKGLLTLQVQPTVEKDKVFGFENDLKTVKGFIEASDNFIVIPIVGITGSGKTIFASMVFEEYKCIPENFNKYIWVNVSQDFDRKQKFIDIIYQITSRREDISMMTEEGLAREICQLLKNEKYFVVLDDVRKKEDWDSFKVVFPTNLKGSRVLVTSPYGNIVDSNWRSHNLEKFSNGEGWLLLKNNAFGIEGCNDEVLENLGKEIANKCNGLPLALVAVGGMLRQRRNIADWVLNIEFSIEFYSLLSDELDMVLPNELYNLHLLRYLAIKTNLNSLPKSFKNLRGLETLVIETTSWKLKIDKGIWNMNKLRHVHTNTSLQLPPFPPKRSTTNSGGKPIHTLSTISPTNCTKEIFEKTPNLQKLGVRGDLSEFLKESVISFLFESLKRLENLKLYGQYDKVLTFPSGIVDAPRLKKLSFSGTLFEWKDMRVLGSLEELEVLKLDDYAFKGENWELSNDVVFKRLQYLRIGRTNLTIWKLATENSFPALRSLILRNCSSLQQIPEAFANVHTLEVMELFHMSESALQSAKEVKEKQLKNCGFQLLIPPGEGPMTEDTDTMIEKTILLMADYVEWVSDGHPGLYSELKDVSFDIQTFNAKLQEAYKNPSASVDVLMVKTFQNIVNEARDAALRYFFKNTSLTKLLVLRYKRNVKFCASEIQSVRSKMNMFRQQHENDLHSLTKMSGSNVLLPTVQIERPIGFDKAIEKVEQAVNMLVQTVGYNVNHIMKSEIEDITSEIKTFTENLVVACKSPLANEHRLLRLIVKQFGTHMHEARDAVSNYFAQEKKSGLAKAFDKIRLCGKLNNVASEIQSIKEKVKTICEDHKAYLQHLQEDYNNRSDDLPPPKNEICTSVKIKKERMSSSSRFAVQSTCIVCVSLGESRQTEAITSFRFECSRSVKGLLHQ
nr:putative late blight resistance protein homolog R1B-8 [Ipomoea batatas]